MVAVVEISTNLTPWIYADNIALKELAMLNVNFEKID